MKSSSVALIAICLCLGVSCALADYDGYSMSYGGGYGSGYGSGYGGGYGSGYGSGYGNGHGKGYYSTETVIRQPYVQPIALPPPPPIQQDDGLFGLGGGSGLLLLGLPLLFLLRNSNSG